MRFHIKKTYIILSILVCAVIQLHAVPATPYPVTYTQPDGSEITIRIVGDEYFHYQTTDDGYIVAEDKAGYFTYAEIDNEGEIIPTTNRATDKKNRTTKENRFLKNLSVNQDISTLVQRSEIIRHTTAQEENTRKISRNFPTKNSPKSLVILVNFSNLEYITPNANQAFTDLLNKKNYSENDGTGSARDYFYDNSMGEFTPEFIVAGPYTLSQTMEYYGTDQGGEGNDVAPEEMVLEACQLAHDDGIKFSDFDEDNDGYVDNIFIFYAGYNQAEGGGAATIWPHNNKITNRNLTLDGKRIYSYACSSELRSNKGNEMCGIGTFVHEFGHVLGLLDYYITAGYSNHHTLSDWNVMDAGAYLNRGKTPPAYSAYDRFFLGWLTPELLTRTTNITLEPLTTSNKAYIITANDVHNLNGANPNPVEFITLENRQKIGWDTYLPGHGLLVTRIYYNQYTWNINTINNSANSMGVDIIEADGKANKSTLSGDPFPGTANVTSYTPTLRDGTVLDKKLVNIQEQNGNVTFTFMGTGELFPPTALEATDITSDSFTANWEESTQTDTYYLSVYHITEGTSQLTESFDNGLNVPIGWSINATETTTDQQYIGNSAPAIVLQSADEYIQTESYILPVEKLTFSARTANSVTGKIALTGWNGVKWKTIDEPIITTTSGNPKEYTFTDKDQYTQFRFEYPSDNSAKIAIDDIDVTFGKRLTYLFKDKETTKTSETVSNLYSDFEYRYRVRAGKTASELVQISIPSNEVTVKTAKGGNNSSLDVYISDGMITVFIPNDTLNNPIRIYDVAGRMIQELENTEYNFREIYNLKKGHVYIIRVGKLRTKIIL